MNIHRTLFPLIAAVVLVGGAKAQMGQYNSWEENYTVQALLGAVQYENFKFDLKDSAERKEVDVSLLPQLGGAWTTLPKGDRFQYGLETSFLLGFRFDKLNYLVLGGTSGLQASIEVSMWTFDLSGGAYASLFVDPERKVRIYAGGGPLMVYADYWADRKYDDGITEDEKTSESAFGLGLYARAGIEFRTHEKGMLGLGARGNWSSVDFSDVGGRSS
jgi:hypothetical protein